MATTPRPESNRDDSYDTALPSGQPAAAGEFQHEPVASAELPAHTEPAADTGPERRPIGKSPEGIKHTRAAATWTGLVVGALILVVLLIFIVQNLETAPVHIFAWTLDLPLGVSILLAAILGALIMALAGGVRILQIRRAAKRK